MYISSILGMAGTIIGLVRALPQLLSLLHSKKAFGVSVDTATTSAVVGFGWAAYGILTGQPFVTLATGSSATVFLLIAFFAVRFGRQAAELKIAPIWLIVLVSAYFFKDEIGLGIILPISILVSNIPQIIIASKESNLADLSLGTWLLSVSDGLVWGGYSLIELDYSIMTFALLQLATSGIIVAFKLIDKKKFQNSVV